MKPHQIDPSLDRRIERTESQTSCKHLIEKHGDIPEIDIFLKHFPFSAIQQGETKITIENTVTLEEDLEYKRALAVLFPSKENQKSYEDALRIAEQSKH